MRSLLFASGLADLALSLRDRTAMIRGALSHPDVIGATGNDQIARRLLDRICLPGRTFVDVGAHIGSVIYGVRRHSHPGRIIAIEAIPDKAVALRRNFPWAEVIESAVGDREGRAMFSIDLDESGYSSLRDIPSDHRVRQIEVPINRLDVLISDHASVDVIKIDVEGSEDEVLRGADQLVSNARPIILFESVPSTQLYQDKKAIWAWFNDREYQIILPNRLAHKGINLSEESFIDAHIYPPRAMNYFAAPSERRLEVRDRARQILAIDAVDDSSGT